MNIAPSRWVVIVSGLVASSAVGCSSNGGGPSTDASNSDTATVAADSKLPDTGDTQSTSSSETSIGDTSATTDTIVASDTVAPSDTVVPVGICPGGPYPTPSLSGTPAPVFSNTGSGLFEGPVWLDRGVLLFSDMNFAQTIPPSTIHQLTPPSTEKVFLANSGTNGMALDPSGNIIACAHDVQGLVRIDSVTGAKTTWVNKISGKSFNSPNDLAVRADGTVYFSDPDWQLGGRTNATGMTGLYRVTPDGTVSLVDGTLTKPNGVSLSPDQTLLYVGAYDGKVYSFAIAGDGTASNRQVFASATEPDGMAIDCAGNVYVASKTQVVVFNASGTSLGTINLSLQVTNLAFGGTDRKTLFITAGKSLFSLPMNVPGYPY